MLAFALTSVSAQSPLPAGVVRVSFGVPVRTKNSAGTETCRITQPLPAPVVFARGATNITYAVELEPQAVKSAKAQFIAPAVQGQMSATPCNVFTLVRGGYSQTQIGNTISRADNQPLVPGAYLVRITVDGQTADVSFTIK